MQYMTPSLYELASRLDAPAPLCDPEFDAVYEDLDREFAHLCLHSTEGGSDA